MLTEFTGVLARYRIVANANKTLSDHAQRAFLVWAIRVSSRAVIHSGSSATGTEEKALGKLLVRFALLT